MTLGGDSGPHYSCIEEAQIPAEEGRVSEREQERDSEDAAEEETETDPEVAEEESKAADRDPLSGY